MKRLLLGLLLVSFASFLFAGNIDLAQATKVAKNAYYQKLNKFNEQTKFDALSISETFTISKEGNAVYYVFNFDNYGYIIISAEDNWRPVIAYSFDGQYQQENQPENFAGWMDSRAEHIQFIRDTKIEATDEITQAWDELLNLNTTNPVAKDGGKSVESLLTSTWNQDSPYNYYCPLDPQGSGGRVYVGCVATAMVQIMYYWRYPYQGSGEHTYWCTGYGYQTANFGEATYDWDAMIDNSDQKVNLEMAEIGFHAGVAVNMQYGWDGSGAYSDDVPYAMRTYFGYSNSCQYLQKSSYQWSVWGTMIQTELDDDCPIYYSGRNNSNAGHAFVLDGYHTGDETFHFNFGWSGYGNGWFDITSSSGYEWYYQQAMVRNFYPGDDAYPYGCSTSGENNNLVGSFEDGSGPMEDYDSDADCSWLISPQNGQDSVTSINAHFVFMDTDTDDVVTIYDGNSSSAPVLGTYSGASTPPDNITTSGNEMFITFEANGDGNTGAGWKMEFGTTRPSWCSGLQTLTDPTGTINDGSGDFYYKESTNCMWKIEPQWASDVTLTFTEFNTEEIEDELNIYDATNNQLLATLSGDYTGNLPDPIYCENGEIFITFQSNNTINGPGWTADWSIGNTAVDEQKESFSKLSIYPNPSENILNISFYMDKKQTIETKLISVTGEVVYTEKATDFLGNYSNTIDISKLAKGVYFLNLTNDTESINKKVVVK